jgi:hypothetical protein
VRDPGCHSHAHWNPPAGTAHEAAETTRSGCAEAGAHAEAEGAVKLPSHEVTAPSEAVPPDLFKSGEELPVILNTLRAPQCLDLGTPILLRGPIDHLSRNTK